MCSPSAACDCVLDVICGEMETEMESVKPNVHDAHQSHSQVSIDCNVDSKRQEQKYSYSLSDDHFRKPSKVQLKDVLCSERFVVHASCETNSVQMQSALVFEDLNVDTYVQGRCRVPAQQSKIACDYWCMEPTVRLLYVGKSLDSHLPCTTAYNWCKSHRTVQ